MSKTILPFDDGCPVCNECPAPWAEWDSIAASQSKAGFNAYSGNKVYLQQTQTVVSYSSLTSQGTSINVCGFTGCCARLSNASVVTNISWEETSVYDPVTGVTTVTGPSFSDVTGSQVTNDSVSSVGGKCEGAVEGLTCSDGDSTYYNVDNVFGKASVSCGTPVVTISPDGATRSAISTFSSTYNPPTYGGTGNCAGLTGGGGLNTNECDVSDIRVRSVEYTNDALRTKTLAALPGFDNDWDDTPGSSSTLSFDEKTLSLRQGKYRWRFPVSKVGKGKKFKIDWVERFLPGLTYSALGVVSGGGSALTSIVAVKQGAGYQVAKATAYLTEGAVSAYLTDTGNGYSANPVVTIAAPPAGGTQATATATVADGHVSAFTITNPGSGYTEAPVVTFSAPSGGTAPTVTISNPGNGGVTATATVTLNADGSINAVNLGNAGTRYTFEPTVHITASPHGLGYGAVFHVHLGTETVKTYTWDGVKPGDYDPEDPTTYPKSPESVPIPIPLTNGETRLALVVWTCR
jgi:hypothetical protein